MIAETGLFDDDDDEIIQSAHNVFDSDQENDENRNEENTAEDANSAGDTSQVVKPKRVVRNPLPKLDVTRLMGPRGIGILQSTFKDVKFKGKGNEKEDLDLLMKNLEHWAHRLFPKWPFDDTLHQLEKLGNKKQVKTLIKKIRLDMFEPGEMSENRSEELDMQTETTPEIDVFDELLGSDPFSQHSPTSSSPIVTKKNSLTSEQHERMERNRLLALEKRKKKQTTQSVETHTDTTDIDYSLTTQSIETHTDTADIEYSSTTQSIETHTDTADIEYSSTTQSIETHTDTADIEYSSTTQSVETHTDTTVTDYSSTQINSHSSSTILDVDTYDNSEVSQADHTILHSSVLDNKENGKMEEDREDESEPIEEIESIAEIPRDKEYERTGGYENSEVGFTEDILNINSDASS